MHTILAIISGICLVTPFFIWSVIKFIEGRDTSKILHWKKKVLITSLIICFLLSMLFLVLAIVFW